MFVPLLVWLFVVDNEVAMAAAAPPRILDRLLSEIVLFEALVWFLACVSAAWPGAILFWIWLLSDGPWGGIAETGGDDPLSASILILFYY